MRPVTRIAIARFFVWSSIAGLPLLVASIATAQDWAKKRLEDSPRHHEYVNLKQGDRELNCFVAYPEVAEKAHAVVVIHDISGLGDWIRGVGDQLAEAGYIAIVPDLVSGMGPEGGNADSFAGVEGIRRVIPKLPPDQVTADLDAAAKYVAKLPSAKGTVSIAGFCWGGGQSLRYATNNPNLASAFVFYGYEPIDATSVARVACPIYGFYGENDNRINSFTAEVTKLMAEAKKTYEPVVYKGAGHGFMRQGEDPAGTVPNKQAREEGWVRWKELLKKH